MITVVTGPPCSGKTTYVQQHAQPGDVIVDFDLLAQALGSPRSHDHLGPVRDATVAVWERLVDVVLAGVGGDAWIVDSEPSPERRARYEAQEVSVVRLVVPAEELHRRAKQSGRSPRTHRVIGAWSRAGGRPSTRPWLQGS